MYRYLVILLFLCSCGNKDVTKTSDNTGLQVRYRNASRETFRVLETQIVAHTKHSFTDIPPYGVTDFVPVPATHAYHYVKVITDRDTFELQPQDHINEQKFTEGYMTITLDIVTNDDGTRELVFVRAGARPVRDYHTRESDVIDNLFAILNNEDFKTANTFYAPGSKLYDASGKLFAGQPGDYFQQAFAADDINYIYVREQQPSGSGIYVKTYTRRGARSAEYPLCFHFVIKDNRVTEQRLVGCR